MAIVVAPVAGAFFGGAVAGAIGAQIGWAIGSAIYNSQQTIRGPSIGQLAQQTSQEGVPRPIVFGLSPPIGGNIIATSEPSIVVRRKRQGFLGPKVRTEHVFRTYAIGICEGPVTVLTAWRDGKLWYVNQEFVGSNLLKFTQWAESRGKTVTGAPVAPVFYPGDYEQMPDPALETIFGVGTTPAHRGTAYMVMNNEELTDRGGAIPQWSFQVLRHRDGEGSGDGAWPLADVITEICGRAGLEADKVDASTIDKVCRGFAVNNSFAASEALRALSEVFQFDPASYDGKIHFVKRGANSVATITEDDMVDDEEEIEQEARADSISIPRVLHLNYHDIAGGLSTDKQSSERAGDRRAVGELSLQTAVVMTADEAARAVDVNHKVLIEDQKGVLRFSLPDSLLRLAPADPIILQWDGRSERCRIFQIDTFEGYQQYTAVRDRQSAYTSNVEGIPAAPVTPVASSEVGPTLIEALDIPPLLDNHATFGVGYYVATSGLLASWLGAEIEITLDGSDAVFDDGTSPSVPSIMGQIVSTLGDHPVEYPDEVNTVTVRIDTPDGELEETTLAGMLNGNNLAIVGDEIVQFANAEETSEGVWELSYFLRGRKGTASVEHEAGERFVLLDHRRLMFVPGDVSLMGRTLTLTARSIGGDPEESTSTSFALAGNLQKERKPAYLDAHLSGGGDTLDITWQGVGLLGAGANTAHGPFFAGFHVEVTDGLSTIAHDTLDQFWSVDVSGLTPPLTVAVSQRNRLAGLGEAAELEVS